VGKEKNTLLFLERRAQLCVKPYRPYVRCLLRADGNRAETESFAVSVYEHLLDVIGRGITKVHLAVGVAFVAAWADVLIQNSRENERGRGRRTSGKEVDQRLREKAVFVWRTLQTAFGNQLRVAQPVTPMVKWLADRERELLMPMDYADTIFEIRARWLSMPIVYYFEEGRE